MALMSIKKANDTFEQIGKKLKIFKNSFFFIKNISTHCLSNDDNWLYEILIQSIYLFFVVTHSSIVTSLCVSVSQIEYISFYIF